MHSESTKIEIKWVECTNCMFNSRPGKDERQQIFNIGQRIQTLSWSNNIH